MQNSENSPCGGEQTRCTPLTPEQVHFLLKTQGYQPDSSVSEWISEIDNDALIRYVATLFRDHPQFLSWGKWLTSSCTAFPPFVEYDAEATTFTSCGIILLAALVADSRSAELIAQATSFPVAFVKMTLGLADQISVWISYNARALRRQLVVDTFCEVNATLSALSEDYWMAIPTFASDVLVSLRAGHQFGEKTDDWADAEDVSNTE